MQWFGDDILGQINACIMRGIVVTTEEVRNEMIRLILDTPKSGRVYNRGAVAHRASAPGEPPASDTGQLVNSIRTEYLPEELTGIVHVSAEHGMFLEFGTRTIEPRPFARPAAANIMPNLAYNVASELGRGTP